MGPSPHLTWSELACTDGTPYPEAWRASRAVPLAQEFERIRAACGGKPVTVGSAYRTAAYNATVPGSASNSQHVQGRALDLYPPAGMAIEVFYGIIRAIAKDDASKITGLGRYPRFVHIDTRPAGHLTVWRGSRAWAEPKDA